ncbi:ABC-type nitrate/sulfonate/bicarbonate transport system, substrate-binding protein [Massilia sp. PDC64]|nr:ABC transporter substrate-binding protein [Massilia sp. PDC64]SDE79198.1 ABC-type nitrate/sulfonate/bicarbonate transport system, substrate-binding protein [Massilia sp. PDC64]
MTTPIVETIWYTRCPVPTPVGIAAHLGWFEQEFGPDGIAIETLQDGRNAGLRASHIDHTLQHSFRQGGSIPALWARSQGADTRVIGLTWIDESQLILALPQSGIRTVRDLRGRRIGLPSRPGQRIDIFRAAALRGFLGALGLEGLGARDVEIVDVPAQDVGAAASPQLRQFFSNPASATSRALYAAETRALLRGDVDAIYAKGSLGLELAHLIGARVVTDIGFHPDPKVRVNNGSPRPLTVDRAFINARPDLVARFLRRVADVDDWGREHPHDVLDFLGRETGSTHEWLRLAYGKDVHRKLVTGLAPDAIAALADFKDFLLAWGFLPHDFDVAAWVDHTVLDRLAIAA